MSDAFAQFEQRLCSLERKHRELAKGYVTKVNPDGLIVVAPKYPKGSMRARLTVGIILGFFLFKCVTMVLVGPALYESRLEELRQGTGPERFGAWIMQVDPISGFVADAARNVVR